MTETTANYWSGYYATHNIGDPSLFAQFVSETVASSGRLLDIGCGTGRDSYHFAKSGCDVIAVDLAAEPKDATKCIFKKGDMGKLEELNLENGFDTFYSRFSIHSVPEHIQAAMFKQAKELLKVGGVLCIEARSTKDPLYGVGTPMGRHAFAGKTGHADAHYRRFIDASELKAELEALGFEVTLLEESDKFAPYKTENPVCVRCLATRM